MKHQCPLCLTVHANGRACLCDGCNRKAFALDLLGASVCIGIVGALGLVLFTF